MLGGSLGSLLYGDVSVMFRLNVQSVGERHNNAKNGGSQHSVDKFNRFNSARISVQQYERNMSPCPGVHKCTC